MIVSAPAYWGLDEALLRRVLIVLNLVLATTLIALISYALTGIEPDHDRRQSRPTEHPNTTVTEPLHVRA